MKKLILDFLFFIFMITGFTGSIQASGFNGIHTPDGINIIAVGDSGLIFRSTNSGIIWSGFVYGSENLRSVFSYSNDIWFSGNNGNIYKTQKTISPIYQYNTGSSFVINSIFFINSNTGFVCGNNGNLYKTSNGGVNWSPSNSGISAVDLNAISFKDESRGVVVGKNGFIYTTTNSGQNWLQNFSGTDRNLLDVKYFTDGIYATGESGTLLSNISGNWNGVDLRTDSDIRGITGISFGNSHICGGGGFIRNNLSGISDFNNFEINPMLANLVDIFYYNDYLGFAVSSLNKAIILTSNGGATWDLSPGTSVNLNWVNKLSGTQFKSNTLCRHPDDKSSAFAVDRKKVYVSRNKGESWTQIATISIGTQAHSFYVSPIDTNIWVAAMEYSGTTNCIVRSTNYGLTWNNILSKDFALYGQPLEMDQNDPSVFYFAPTNNPGEGIYKSTNNGETFSLVAAYNSISIYSPNDLIVMWDSSEVLIMGDEGADIWKSTNSANTWTQVLASTSYRIPSICNTVFDKYFFIATRWNNIDVYKTSNCGNNWNVFSHNTESGWGSDICHTDPTVILTASYDTQNFFTTNGGADFFEMNSGSTGVNSGIMVADRDFILSMMNWGMYKMIADYNVITSVVENIVSTLPASFELSQNYPNPFNPTTKIKFSIPNSDIVSLKVYDRLGKEVSDLAGGFRNAGTYEINFDASHLSSGIYFYKLESDNSTVVKKMMLLK